MAGRGERAPDPYGQTFRSVRQRLDSEDGSALPRSAPHPYGQTFWSVRDDSESAHGLSLPNDTPLLPKGLKRPRRSSPRLQRFDYSGPYAYSITLNTDGTRPYLVEDRFVRFCVGTLEKEATVRAFDILAYCFMPNHVHVLALGLTATSRLKPFMKQFKQVAGFAFKQEHGTQLWHRSYHDRVLRKEESIESVSSYIWGNPVRAGLVQKAEDYPYSGPRERLLGEAGRLHNEAAVGGQTLRSVRTDGRPHTSQA